jgi:glycosyltransferase involved in cell wall biosynthesis
MYRTSDALPALLQRIEATTRRCDVSAEIILVDDACPERSADVFDTLPAPGVATRVLRLGVNVGQDAALREGLRACRGDWAVLLDGDLQDPPEAVEALWAARGEGVDAVFADRRGAYESGGRLLTSRIYRRTLAWLAGLPQGACLFVLLPRATIAAVAASRTSRPALLASIAAHGRRFARVPVQRARRGSGTSAYDPRARIAKAARSLWQAFLARRLRIPL